MMAFLGGKMAQFRSSGEALDFAIAREQEAWEFYMNMASKVERPGMKELFEEFADEEKKHKTKLEAVKLNEQLAPVEAQVMDLQMGDYLVADEPGPDTTYQDALILAMKKEKAAFALYTDLAGTATDPGLQELFQALAQEEARHKLRFEMEYDDVIMKDN